MFKTLKTLVLASIMAASAGTAFAETASFSISVTIPPMIVFEQRDLRMDQPMLQEREAKTIHQQTLVRNNKEVVVASAVVL